jgi:glycosyltransferase involved in cell wall biosynthesis
MAEISIIIPCYNHGQYLLEAIESVEQLKADRTAEIIIVNDGSTDKHTIEVLARLEADHWKIITQKNQGLAQARNNGIRSSASPYVLPLDCDNIIIQSFVMDSIKVLNSNSSIDIVYSDCSHFGDKKFYKNVGEFDPCRLINDNYIDACAVYRREVWEELKGYDKNIPTWARKTGNFGSEH